MRHEDRCDERGDGPLQAGPLTQTIEILNQRWTLHIVRGLLGGTMRFNEMARGLGVNACTLRDRLRQLERRGIVHREVVSTFPPKVEYSLTEKGMALHDIFAAIEEWGNRWLATEGPSRRLDPATSVRIGPGRKALGDADKVSS